MPNESAPLDEFEVFISYCRKDRHHAERIRNALDRAKIRYFIDHDLKGGDKFRDRLLAEAITTCRIVCVLVSKASNRSRWVGLEIGAALALGKRIVPILIDVKRLPIYLHDKHAYRLDEVDKAIVDCRARAEGWHAELCGDYKYRVVPFTHRTRAPLWEGTAAVDVGRRHGGLQELKIEGTRTRGGGDPNLKKWTAVWAGICPDESIRGEYRFDHTPVVRSFGHLRYDAATRELAGTIIEIVEDKPRIGWIHFTHL